MGQFKNMVKMMTTEPSIELKLKKGGAVKKADGGAMVSAMPSTMPSSAIGTPRGGMMGAMAPKRPSMAARRRAMAVPPMASAPAMKKGGKAEGGESKAEHMAEMKKMGKVEKELKAHEAKPASKAHKGLKTGGIAKSPKPGNYKTGGVVMGQGGFKKGGVAKSGIINTEDQGGKYRNTQMDTAKVDTNKAPTGDVKLGNAGGYKKGGAAKKAYATGGLVDTGKPVAMPRKAASKPVAINELSGTFKRGGRVKKMAGGGEMEDLSKGAYDRSIGPDREEVEMAKSIRALPGKIYRGAKSLLGLGSPSASERKVIAEDTMPKTGSVTRTEKSVTVSPGKKRGGSVKC